MVFREVSLRELCTQIDQSKRNQTTLPILLNRNVSLDPRYRVRGPNLKNYYL